MLTEADALAAVPPHGFIRDYVVHAVKQTTSPMAYHLLVGLGILAATCPIDYGMTYAGRLRANLFGLLVGRSGEDQKSTAVSVGRELLFHAASPLIGDYPGSPEGLLESLQRVPSQMVPIPEFGRFLSSAKSGYFEPTKALLTDLWDAQAQQRAKANGRVVRVDNPRLSVLAACSVPYLEKYTAPEDWTGGFMGRWAVIYAQRERTDPDPEGDMSGFETLAQDLRARASVGEVADCAGLTPEARELWRAWFNEVSNRRLPETITGIRARAPTIARKVALLYAWDWNRPANGTWLMQRDEIEYAIKFTELHIKSLVTISHVIADSTDARQRREVIGAMAHLGGTCDLGHLVGHLKWKKRMVTEIMESLLEERRVERTMRAGEMVFRLRSDAEVAEVEKGRWNAAPWE
jgi:hypothetical protein